MKNPNPINIVNHNNIVETIFFDLNNVSEHDKHSGNDFYDIFMTKLSEICLDYRGEHRLGVGIVCNSDDLSFVPSKRYEFNINDLYSHNLYVEIDLPNPAIDFNQYKFIRNRMIALLIKIGEDNGIKITTKDFN